MIAGIILAGGLARRMGGGDKTLFTLGGMTILARIAARLAPQVDALALNANGCPERFAATGLPIVPDSVAGHPGPLAGVLAGMEWAADRGAKWLITAPGDAPFVPDDFVARLMAGRGTARFACAGTAGQTHPVAALWPVAARHDLASALASGLRKVDAFTGTGCATVPWPTLPIDPFFNVNTPDELAEAARLLATGTAAGLEV